MTRLIAFASVFMIALLLGAGAALAKKGGGGGAGVCTERKFQACMNRCISNMMVSNGSRITYKCSRRCHKKC